MAVTTTTTAGITSISFTYRAATAQFTKIADQAARYLYSIEYTRKPDAPYDQLTNAQKLDILDRYVFRVLMNARYAQDAIDGEKAKQAIVDAAQLEPPLT